MLLVNFEYPVSRYIKWSFHNRCNSKNYLFNRNQLKNRLNLIKYDKSPEKFHKLVEHKHFVK